MKVRYQIMHNKEWTDISKENWEEMRPAGHEHAGYWFNMGTEGRLLIEVEPGGGSAEAAFASQDGLVTVHYKDEILKFVPDSITVPASGQGFNFTPKYFDFPLDEPDGGYDRLILPSKFEMNIPVSLDLLKDSELNLAGIFSADHKPVSEPHKSTRKELRQQKWRDRRWRWGTFLFELVTGMDWEDVHEDCSEY